MIYTEKLSAEDSIVNTKQVKMTGFKLLKMSLHFRNFFMIFIAISKELNLPICLPLSPALLKVIYIYYT